MRKIAFVAGVVGAAVVLLRRLQGEVQSQTVPAYAGKPMEKQRVEIPDSDAIPFDDLDDKPVAQTAVDDLLLSSAPVVIGNHTDEIADDVLSEPLLPFTEMPVDDAKQAETHLIVEPEITADNVVEPQIAEYEPQSADATTFDVPPLVTAEVEDLPLITSEQESPYVVLPQIEETENRYDEPDDFPAELLEITDDDEGGFISLDRPPGFDKIDDEELGQSYFDALEFGDTPELETDDGYLDTPPMEFLETARNIPDVVVDGEKQKWPGDVLAKEVFMGKVVHFHSADTFQITRSDTGETVQFRLWGINAGRVDAPYGAEALQFSQEFVDGKYLSFEVRASFRDGQRLVGWLIADGESLNVALVENGLARWYSELFPDETLLAGVEAQARAERRGLWGET